MENENGIIRMLQMLEKKNTKSTKEFKDDLINLVQMDLEKFVEIFYKDFIRKNFKSYNRYEILRSLTDKQRKKLSGNLLWRYEYRNNSNLRCIFIILKGNNTDIPILICAFNENGGKTKGKGSYTYNINRAIKIIEKLL